MKMIPKHFSFSVLGCILLCQLSRAVSPPPDGGYPGANTAEGQRALFNLTTGRYNTGIGFFAGSSNSTNSFVTAIGAGALFANTADGNTAIGAGALLSNTAGNYNTATGEFALISNVGTTTGNGSLNSAFGSQALLSNTDGSENTGIGALALASNTTGLANTANGSVALAANTTGSQNTAIGEEALESNIAGNNNIGVGYFSLQANNGSDNTALGTAAGSALTTGSNNICIGAEVVGQAGESNRIHIGDNLPSGSGQSACYIGGVAGQTVDPSGAGQVYIDNFGKLGVFVSSKRFKRDVEPMGRTSEAILALKPVTFHYRNDANNTPCFGLIAEEVAQADPALVLRDKEGQPYSVRYDQVNAMLLNEFLKEHQKVEAQQTRIEEQETAIAELKNAIETIMAHSKQQDSEMQKMTHQMQMSSSHARLAVIKN